MKLQIDFDKKVIGLESDVELGEFVSKMKMLFPDGEWKGFKLETNVEIRWSDPIYVDRWVDWRTWVSPYQQPIIYCSGNSDTFTDVNLSSLSTGTYCIEA